jgi:hypothetical protein
MMIGERNCQIWLDANNPLGALGTRNVDLGLAGSTLEQAQMEGLLFLTWSLTADQQTRIDVQGTYRNPAAPVWQNIIQQVCAATVWSTPYLLAAPMNMTGYVVVPVPWIRFVITDVSGVAHTYTRFYAKAWW